MTPVYLRDFRSLEPKHRSTQQRVLEWLAAAHCRAELNRQAPKSLSEEEKEKLARRIQKLVMRFGCSTDRIESRGSCLGDFVHTDWQRMRIFNLDRHPSGAGFGERSRFYSEAVNEAFGRLYCEDQEAPSAILHVTCTGYASPSGAQRLVAQRGWDQLTEVFHAYHMGCYAALPSLRIAQGLLSCGKHRVDLVHTELCSLHLDPAQHSPEQLVVQTLFSDGLIRYTAAPRGPGLELLASSERLIPDSSDEMSWTASDHGMQMTLSREVPERIAQVLEAFAQAMGEKAGIRYEVLKEKAIFAIHPGGPRIIDEIRKLLGLSEGQVAQSNAVLRHHGNMSSATLPHIWKAILEDAHVPEGSFVVSLAFGPGLTLSGAILRRRVS